MSLIDSFGTIYINPNVDKINECLLNIFDDVTINCPHRDVSLTDYESGYVLIYHHNKSLALDNINHKHFTIRTISKVALDNAYHLYYEFRNKNIFYIKNLQWK